MKSWHEKRPVWREIAQCVWGGIVINSNSLLSRTLRFCLRPIIKYHKYAVIIYPYFPQNEMLLLKFGIESYVFLLLWLIWLSNSQVGSGLIVHTVQLFKHLSCPGMSQQKHETVLICLQRADQDADPHNNSQMIFLSLMSSVHLEHVITLKH